MLSDVCEEDVCMSENNFRELVLFFHHMDPGAQSQIVRLGSLCAEPLLKTKSCYRVHSGLQIPIFLS